MDLREYSGRPYSVVMKRLLVFALFFAAFCAAAQEPGGAAEYFANLPLVDQDGRSVDLYSLMKDRTVVMNTFFATCTGSCPVATRALVAVQNEYADHVGKDLVLLSITVDPATDTPPKLKEYAKAIGAKSGWYFLTGSKEQVDAALRKIGQYVERREEHQNVMIAGNLKTGLWKKIFALAPSKEILPVVDSVLNDNGK